MALDFGDLLRRAESAASGFTGGSKIDGNTRNEMFQKICALIPTKIDNSAVVGAFELMRKQQKAMKKTFTDNLRKNKAAFAKHESVISRARGFVEDQNSYTDMAYGESTMQYSGCEVFATFNAIYSILGKHTIPLPEMISEYEEDGMVLSG